MWERNDALNDEKHREYPCAFLVSAKLCEKYYIKSLTKYIKWNTMLIDENTVTEVLHGKKCLQRDSG